VRCEVPRAPAASASAAAAPRAAGGGVERRHGERAAPPCGAVARHHRGDVTAAVHAPVAGVDASAAENEAAVVGGADEQDAVTWCKQLAQDRSGRRGRAGRGCRGDTRL